MGQPTTAYCPSQEQTNQSTRDWYYLGGSVEALAAPGIHLPGGQFWWIFVGALIVVVAVLAYLEFKRK